ncbi:MAG: foldase protein PrsA [Actinomycetota bacterium]|nr:foldase protein PrsA [Actinomycetota bacterium]
MNLRTHLFRFAAGASLLAVAFASSGCSAAPADAATVNGIHIRRRAFNDELVNIAANDGFVKLLEQNGFKVGGHKKTVDAKLAATWLSLLVQQVAIDGEFNARHLKVTAQERTAAQTSVTANFGQAKVFNRFPKAFRDKIVERQARLDAVGQSIAARAKPVTVAAARAFYDQNKNALFACPSLKTVAHIVLATQAQARDVLTQLQGGANFATLAQQRSTDAATRQQGGVLGNSQGPGGCYAAGSSPQLDDAVNGATLNQPVGPVQTQSGFEVILAKTYAAPSFESVQTQLIAQLEQQAQTTANTNRQAELSKVLGKRLRALKVTIDARYGKWVLDKQGARVVPPAAPKVRDTRNKSTTVPTTNPLGTPPSS